MVDLDLQQDAVDVYSFLASRASAYTPTNECGPGGADPIKMLYAGYEFDQAGWFALVFDRRPDAGHDGEWTSYLDGNMLDRPVWEMAQRRNEDHPIHVRGVDGLVYQLPTGSEFGPLLGQLLVGVLKRAEHDGVFARLPRSEGFKLGLEEFNGSFGWDSELG